MKNHSRAANTEKNLDELYNCRFSSLSVRDLLDARDQYHVHLAHKENVIATAVGLYLIRKEDADFHNHDKTSEAARTRGKNIERTLENSEIKPWSWPCVLVFVREWQTEAQLVHHPESVVPPFLYLSDGRIVPVCVVKAPHANFAAQALPANKLDATVLGPGSPIWADAQKQRRMGTVACIVSDGTDYFALTNKHVAGESGREIRASFQGIGRVVGVSEASNLGTLTFSEVYPALRGRDTYVHLDAGLVRIDDVDDWTTTLGDEPMQIGAMLDFSAETASLDWIGCKLVGYGAASGKMTGEVRALFYRYKAVGGREYVSDFLIGSRTGVSSGEENGHVNVTPIRSGKKKASQKELPEKTGLISAPGDSGTLWCTDPEVSSRGLRPLLVQWGGQKLGSDGSRDQYAQFVLGASIAVICRELELDIVEDFRSERVEYWGAVGHFKIGQQACYHVANPTLRKFLLDNLNNLSYSDNSALKQATGLQASGFVPLADVPDIVWKTNVNRAVRSVTRPQENPNHYADMDLPDDDGKTLFDVCGDNPVTLSWQDWVDYYKDVPAPKSARKSKSGKPKPVEQGCLPFRVWQIFAAMQEYACRNDAELFLCAAGVIAHYVGDACQPLHSSQHADGLNGASTGVHSTYEDNMVERHADDISAGIDSLLNNHPIDLDPMEDGEQTGVEVINLMRRCHQALPPESICQSYNRVHPGAKSPTKRADVLDAMWEDCGQGTIACIADGIRVLASIWEAAFASATDDSKFAGAIDQAALKATYSDKDFLPSKHLEYYNSTDLPGATDMPDSAPQRKKKRA